jgi:hypothetical protein
LLKPNTIMTEQCSKRLKLLLAQAEYNHDACQCES